MPVQRVKVHRVNRRRNDPSSPPPATLAGSTNSIVATKWRVAFNVPVVVTGIPLTFKASTAAAGSATAVPTAVSVVNPTTIDLTFATGPVATGVWNIGVNDPSVRTSTGGFAAPASGTF